MPRHRLILMRHAKSSWERPGLADFDRPLNDRGRQAAPAMAKYLAGRHYRIDFILCSPARRTRETLARMLPFVPGEISILIRNDLYEGDCNDYLARIRATPAQTHDVLVIGHNPSVEELALSLTRDPHSLLARAMAEKFPTAALAVLEFDVEDWQDVAPAQGLLIDFRRPRDIA